MKASSDLFERSSVTLNTLNEILRKCRKYGTTIDARFISGLDTVLESEDGDLCSHFDPSLFSTIIQAVLQAEYCLEGEHVIYLLAVSPTS